MLTSWSQRYSSLLDTTPRTKASSFSRFVGLRSDDVSFLDLSCGEPS